jgi:hypothetical protein
MFNMNWFEFTLLTAAGETSDSAALRLSPNPGSGLIRLQADLGGQNATGIFVTDMLGRSLWNQDLNGTGTLDETLDLQFLPPGCYVISVQMENGSRWAEKIIIR